MQTNYQGRPSWSPVAEKPTSLSSGVVERLNDLDSSQEEADTRLLLHAAHAATEINVCCGNNRIRRYRCLGTTLGLQEFYTVLHVHQMQFPDESKVLRCFKDSRANWSKYMQIIAGIPCVYWL